MTDYTDYHYCYPDSDVLVNKLNITDSDVLSDAEREITSLRIARAKLSPIKGRLDFKHLLAIHKYIFGDIYSWAGNIRDVDISKENMFCHNSVILTYAEKIFNDLKSENFLIDTPSDEIIPRFSYYLSEINVLHPFREGNGRCQRLFIEYLATVSGYHIDFSKISTQEMISASASAFCLNYEPLNMLLDRAAVTVTPEFQQKFITKLNGHSFLYKLYKSKAIPRRQNFI